MNVPSAGRQLRALLLIDTLQLGGPARLLVDQARGLRQRGTDARVAHLGIGNWSLLAAELKACGVPLLNLHLGGLLDPRPVLWLARYLSRQQIDLIHTHNRYAHIVGRVAAALARRPVVSTVHSIVETDLGWRGAVRRELDYVSARTLCTAVITVSEAQREVYSRASRVRASRVETHLNGIDVDRFRPDPVARTVYREQLGQPEAAPLFATVAVLRPGKGVEHLLKAAAAVRIRIPEARFVVIGDGPERTRLQGLAARLGLETAVSFLGTRTEVPALLSAADVYVHPALYDALPTSVLEAMAMGLPVVATAVGGIPELILHGRTGLLVPPAEPSALAAAMLRALDPSLKAEVGPAARAWVQEHASIHVWLDGLEQLYRRVIGHGSCRPRPVLS